VHLGDLVPLSNNIFVRVKDAKTASVGGELIETDAAINMCVISLRI
jgi:hypothetical protein